MTSWWVLIVLLTYGGKADGFSQEFNGEQACRAAITEIRRDWPPYQAYAYCVPKGDGR
jgi:hypothetical protein